MVYLSSLVGSQSKVNARPQFQCFDKVGTLQLARHYMNRQGGGNAGEGGCNVSELNQVVWVTMEVNSQDSPAVVGGNRR